MTSPQLTLTDIRKSFGGVRALAGASIELRGGAVTALVGENGAGKSTLVKILSGVHQPDAGEIRLDGNAIRIDSPSAARGRRGKGPRAAAGSVAGRWLLR